MGCVRYLCPAVEVGGADDVQDVQEGGHGRKSVQLQHCGSEGIADHIHKEGRFHTALGGSIVQDAPILPTDLKADDGCPGV